MSKVTFNLMDDISDHIDSDRKEWNRVCLLSYPSLRLKVWYSCLSQRIGGRFKPKTGTMK